MWLHEGLCEAVAAAEPCGGTRQRRWRILGAGQLCDGLREAALQRPLHGAVARGERGSYVERRGKADVVAAARGGSQFGDSMGKYSVQWLYSVQSVQWPYGASQSAFNDLRFNCVSPLTPPDLFS